MVSFQAPTIRKAAGSCRPVAIQATAGVGIINVLLTPLGIRKRRNLFAPRRRTLNRRVPARRAPEDIGAGRDVADIANRQLGWFV